MIKPVSELRNYPEILKEVKVGSPVYLTKNGTGRYVLIDIADYSNVEAAAKLSLELMRGRLSDNVAKNVPLFAEMTTRNG